MESNIGFLRQLYALEKMRRQGVTEAIQAELKEATDFYHEAVDSMLGTGLFDIEEPANLPARHCRQSIALCWPGISN